MSSNFIVFTGGPGSGKTSVIDELARRGLATMPEAGRGVIKAQLAKGGSALPWADRAAFAKEMLAWELRNYELAAGHSGPVFFDRGIPDIVGYLNLCGLPVPDDVLRAAQSHRYNTIVFAFPFWPEIFVNDAERKQDAAEAQATFHAVTAAWRASGYDVAVLKKAPVAERVLTILQQSGL